MTLAGAAARLANLGFLASGGQAESGGIAYLLVAVRDVPSQTHFDPERIDYWVTESGRGSRQSLDRATRLPLASSFSWGQIRITDRFGEENEYIGFGGELNADRVDGMVVAAFTSAAPLMVGGGHSQGGDHVAATVGAFFGRLLLGIDYVPRLEGRVAQADPVARYAAFLATQNERYRSSPGLRGEEPGLARWLEAEERRIRASQPAAWSDGQAISSDLFELASTSKGR